MEAPSRYYCIRALRYGCLAMLRGHALPKNCVTPLKTRHLAWCPNIPEPSDSDTWDFRENNNPDTKRVPEQRCNKGKVASNL